MTVEFEAFRKIPRLTREIVVTEKIDGTNGVIHIGEDGTFLTGSRSQWIAPTNDNYGFSKWAHDHKDELMLLGPGTHYGEWWGQGIQRRYDLTEKRFSLFNVLRWGIERPACCHVVPILWEGMFDTGKIQECLDNLRISGSVAAPGFQNPEGVIIYHKAANLLFKKTIEKDAEWKGKP